MIVLESNVKYFVSEAREVGAETKGVKGPNKKSYDNIIHPIL